MVFGAGGFIGANLFRAIASCRDDCFAVTHQSGIPQRLHDVPARQILRVDLRDKAAVERLFDVHRFRTIFNLSTYGAFAHQHESEEIFGTNVMGLVHLVGAAERHGFAALIQGGSSSEYGLNCAAPEEGENFAPTAIIRSARSPAPTTSSIWERFAGCPWCICDITRCTAPTRPRSD